MDNYTILYYTIQYYTIRYYTILFYSILYYTILYYTILYYTILYYTILYYTILYYTILYYTIENSRLQGNRLRGNYRILTVLSQGESELALASHPGLIPESAVSAKTTARTMCCTLKFNLQTNTSFQELPLQNAAPKTRCRSGNLQ